MRIFVSAVLIAVAASANSGVTFAATPTNQAEFLSGTLKTIPTNTVGALDLSDPAEMHFRYGDLTYSLPYQQIQGFRFSNAKPQPRTIGHVPVPRVNLPFHAHEQVLDVSFADKEGPAGNASFRLSGKSFASAEWVLSERVRQSKESAQNAKLPKVPESWWGDKYWKTNRNRPGWNGATAEQTGTK